MHRIMKFWKDEEGLETVEYAVMTALVVAAVVTAVGLLKDQIVARFDAVTQAITPTP